MILPNSHLKFGSSFGIQVVRAGTGEGIWYECPGYCPSPSYPWINFKVIREPSLQTYSCACLCFWVPPFNPHPCHLPSWRVNKVFSAKGQCYLDLSSGDSWCPLLGSEPIRAGSMCDHVYWKQCISPFRCGQKGTESSLLLAFSLPAGPHRVSSH